MHHMAGGVAVVRIEPIGQFVRSARDLLGVQLADRGVGIAGRVAVGRAWKDERT